MERMPLTRAMGLALECFQKIIPTTRHSFHVIWVVRKATLNEPKVLRIRVVFGIRELLRRFGYFWAPRSEEHTSELQSRENLVCRLLLEKKKKKMTYVVLYKKELVCIA